MQLDPGMLDSVSDRLDELVGLLRGASLVHDEHSEFEAERLRIIAAADDYLMPRLASIDAPVVAAIVGPTGTGKSTILNSLAQDLISDTGVLRPTTGTPVVWAHRERADLYWSEFVARVKERVGPGVDLVVGLDAMTAHVTLIDTPPIDFIGEADGFTARDVLEVADICIFVTSPSRYADAIGWDFVHEARMRGVPTLFVLNRLPSGSPSGESSGSDQAVGLLEDLARRLHERGLLLEPDPAMIFPVAEQTTMWHNGLGATEVAALRRELEELGDAEFRGALMTQTALTTAVSLGERAGVLVDALAAESTAAGELRRGARKAYEEQADQLRDDLVIGTFSDVAKRDIWRQAAADLAAVVTRRAGVAAQIAASRWAADGVGGALLQGEGHGLWRHGETTAVRTSVALEAFADETVEMAGRYARRSPLRTAAARAMADEAWRLAVDPDASPGSPFARRYGEDLASFIAAVRTELVGILTECVRADGDRFLEHLGEPIAPELADEVAAAAVRLLTLARSAVPSVGSDGPLGDERDA